MKCIPHFNFKRISCPHCLKCGCIHLPKKNKVENEIGKYFLYVFNINEWYVIWN